VYKIFELANIAGATIPIPHAGRPGEYLGELID